MANGPEPFSIGIEIFARLAKLDQDLKTAEAKIDAAAKRMAAAAANASKGIGDKMADGPASKFMQMRREMLREAEALELQDMESEGGMGGSGGANKFEQAGSKSADKFLKAAKKKFKKVLGFGFGIGVADMITDSLADAFEQGKGIGEAALIFGEKFSSMLEATPIAGGLGRMLAMAIDPLFGGNMALERAQQKSREKAQELFEADQARLRRLEKEKRALAEIAALEQKIVDARLTIESRERSRGIEFSRKNLARSEDVFANRTRFDSVEDVDAAAARLRDSVRFQYETEKRLLEEQYTADAIANSKREDIHAREKEANLMLIRDEHQHRLRLLKQEFDERVIRTNELAEQERREVMERLEEERQFKEKVLDEQRRGRIREQQATQQFDAFVAQAKLKTQQMTNTAQTHGGSFTYAVRAQVDHTKLMADAMIKIPDMMMIIINNMMRMGMVTLG